MCYSNAETFTLLDSINSNIEYMSDDADDFELPEMSDIEKDVIVEWVSLGENPEYVNQPCHGVNLFELIRILAEKYTLMVRRMPRASVEARLRAFNWTPCPSPVGGELNIFHNPLCSLLIFRIMIEMGRNDSNLQGNRSDLENKIIDQFHVIKSHYFNITD